MSRLNDKAVWPAAVATAGGTTARIPTKIPSMIPSGATHNCRLAKLCTIGFLQMENNRFAVGRAHGTSPTRTAAGLNLRRSIGG